VIGHPLPGSTPASSSRALPPAVLILCADERLAEALIRELAGRRYQPLVGWPGWTWASLLEWAHPVAAVVDARHPAAKSGRLLPASGDVEVGLVVVDESADVRLIGGAVDATVRRRSV
jgi:hypothetical protein